ncbi:hypothetical protein [Pandoraea sp. ISTKB]|uniref:hypothetical protein n=1 Tax=Pandoraea sp. ISTKB TaxID=1586708 RepID=UPI001112DC91|nr:hypothetical protein [Pandoraea sp. ISTKB]
MVKRLTSHATSTPPAQPTGPAATGSGAPRAVTAQPASRQFDAPVATLPARDKSTPASASGDKSLISRMQSKLFARAVVIQPGVTGTTLTRHRPTGPAATPAKLPGDPDLSPGALLTLAQQMHESLTKSEIEVWTRPAPSPARQRLVRMFPFLSAGPTRNIARLNVHHVNDVGRAPSGNAKPSTTEPHTGTVPASVKTLIERIDRLQGELDTALTHVKTAEQGLRTATQAHDRQIRLGTAPGTPDLVTTEAAVTEARAALERANLLCDASANALHRTLHGPEALMIASINFHEQEAQAHTAFALDRIGDFSRQVDRCRQETPGKLDDIKAAMQTGNDAVRHLMTLAQQADEARQQAASAEAEVNRLSAKLAKLPGDQAPNTGAARRGQNDGADPSLHARTLLHRLQTAQASYERATSVVARIEADHGDLEAAITQKMGELETLLSSRGEVVRDAHHAERLASQLDVLRQDTPALKTPTGKRPDSQDAIQTLGEHIARVGAANTSRFPPAVQARIAPLLQAMADRLRAQTSVPMPDHGIAEIVSDALHTVLGDAANDEPADGEYAVRAERTLSAMATRPAAYWTRPDGASNQTASDVHNLCRELSRLPRGADLIHCLSADGDAAPDKETRTALRVFWAADAARTQTGDDAPDDDVKAWLGSACEVAAAKLAARGDTGADDTARHDDVALSAYHAVRNGYTSNAADSPYAVHNARIHKASEDWVMYANASASPQPRPRVPVWVKLWRKVSPLSEKTPFRPATIRNANHLSERIGLSHPTLSLDRAVRRKIETAEAQTAQALTQPLPPEAIETVLVAKCIVSHLKQLETKGAHLSEVALGPHDLADVKRRVLRAHKAATPTDGAPAAPNNRPHTGSKAPMVALPAEYFALFDERRSAYEAMETINRSLTDLLPPAAPDAGDTDNRAANANASGKRDSAALEKAALDYVRTGKLADKTGVEMLLSSYVEDFRTGHRIRVAGGGTLGGGLPKLPVVVSPSVVTPVFSAEASVSREASLQIAMNTLSLEVSIGQVQTKAAETTVGAAIGGAIGGPVSAQGAITAKFATSRTRTQATVLREPRTPKNDDKTRNEMLDVIHSTLQWDTLKPERGPSFASPLEAIFARHPTISIVELLERGRSDTTTVRAAATLPGIKRKSGEMATQTAGLEFSIAGEHDKARSHRTEAGGGVQINAMGVNAQQRVTVGATAAFSPIANQTAKLNEHGASAPTQSLPLGISMTRDVYWHMDRKDISAFQVDGKFDADLDRYHATARDMLTEISANRESWLRQAVSKMTADESGEKNTPMNRMRAAAQLEAFESAVREIDRTNKLCHFQINYSLSPHIGPWIDNLRALAQQADSRGDHEAANRARNDIDAVLQMPGAWHATRLAVRKRVKDQQALGVRTFIRMQTTRTAEGQQTLAQFPAP